MTETQINEFGARWRQAYNQSRVNNYEQEMAEFKSSFVGTYAELNNRLDEINQKGKQIDMEKLTELRTAILDDVYAVVFAETNFKNVETVKLIMERSMRIHEADMQTDSYFNWSFSVALRQFYEDYGFAKRILKSEQEYSVRRK